MVAFSLTFGISLFREVVFLNSESPQYYPNDATFFKTQEQFTQAVNGAYSALRGVSARQGYLMGEMRSDNTHYTRYKADRGLHILYRENIADFVVDDQNQWTNEMYYACYTGISRANTILNRIEGTTFPDDFKNKTIGEAKFIRAFMYFQLVQCYGDVPLHLEEVTGADNAFLPRSSVNDIYTAIVDDVKDAIEKLPTVKFPQNGAATKGAAKMLYAYVLMTKPDRDYATAETQLKDIMNMGYELLPNYADIYDTSKKNYYVTYDNMDVLQMLQSTW
mgnify:CR=1 FL=1